MRIVTTHSAGLRILATILQQAQHPHDEGDGYARLKSSIVRDVPSLVVRVWEVMGAREFSP